MTDRPKPPADKPLADEASADEALIDLVVRYLDNELPEADVERLRALLSDNPHNRAVFVDVCLQAKLCTEILGNRLHDVAASGTLVSSTDPIPIEAVPPSTGSVILGFLTSSLRSIPGGETAVGHSGWFCRAGGNLGASPATCTADRQRLATGRRRGPWQWPVRGHAHGV